MGATLFLTALIAVSLGIYGCDHRDPQPSCPDRGFEPCDLRVDACQERLFRVVDCVTAEAAGRAPPPVKLVGRADFAAAALAVAETATESARIAQSERAYEMFGLLRAGDLQPLGQAERRLRHLTAFYSVDEDRVTMLVDDPEEPVASAVAQFALAHEFAHALQDREYDLTRFFEEHQGSYDQILAARALSEGDAQVRAALALHGEGDVASRASAARAALLPEAEPMPLTEPAPLLEAPYHFTYDYGARYVEAVRQRAGLSGVSQLFSAPATDSATILAAVELGAEPPTRPEPNLSPRLPPGYARLAGDTLGAVALQGFVAKQLADLELARTLALNWAGDGIGLFRGPGSAVAVIWTIGWIEPYELCARLRVTGFCPDAASAACRDTDAATVLACSDDPTAIELVELGVPAPP